MAILGDPRAIVTGVVGGFLSGYFVRPVGESLAPYGTIYVSLLAMCILPMMTCAIIAGLGHMLRSPHTRRSFRKLATVYALGLLVPGLAGILAAAIGRPGTGLDPRDLSSLGEVVLNAESAPPAAAGSGRLLSFVGRIVPHNVFAAYSEGRVISIIFVSILVGLALGLIHAHKAEDALRHVAVVYEAFVQIFEWVIILLPVGLFCLIAGLAATVNPVLLKALLRYMVVFWAAGALLLIGYHCLLWRSWAGRSCSRFVRSRSRCSSRFSPTPASSRFRPASRR
jgi:proton glutamate symport protein